MESLYIKPTPDTPKVSFEPGGELVMEGRSLPENPSVFYTPLLQWADQIAQEKLVFSLKLEYFNTASSKQIFTLIKKLIGNPNIKETLVKWHYEEGDYDSLEMGQQYQNLLQVPFEFIEVPETEF